MCATNEHFRNPFEEVGAKVYLFKNKNLEWPHEWAGKVF